MLIRPYQPTDETAVVNLWTACGLTRPWNDPHKDIARKLQVQPELLLVGTLDDQLVASVMAGFDGHRGWVNYLAVSPNHQMKGYARQMMGRVQERLKALGCPKLNLQIRSSNESVIEFYKRLGYVQDDVVSMGLRLIADE
jgi:ribosomal protein S18 acetylase RimI-like enzyme